MDFRMLFKLQNDLQNGTSNYEKSDIAENVILATLTTNNLVFALPKLSISEQNSHAKVVPKREPRKNRHFKVPRASPRGKEAERLSNGSRQGAQINVGGVCKTYQK